MAGSQGTTGPTGATGPTDIVGAATAPAVTLTVGGCSATTSVAINGVTAAMASHRVTAQLTAGGLPAAGVYFQAAINAFTGKVDVRQCAAIGIILQAAPLKLYIAGN